MRPNLNRRYVLLGLLLILLTSYWLLPIRGQIIVSTDSMMKRDGGWPQIWLDPAMPRAGETATIYVRDNTPWANVQLLVNHTAAQRDVMYPTGSEPWTWRWHFTMPNVPLIETVVYHSCASGCIERGRATFGNGRTVPTAPPLFQPTKLGVVFADPARDWHGRSGWVVDLTYSQRADDADWGIDDLARRVALAHDQGLRVLVRVAYDQGQSLPPADDELALTNYLAYCARLARDDRLRDVYGYIIGSGFNTQAENTLAPTQPTTPAWYARVLVGYSIDPHRTDNVLQTIHTLRPNVQVLVGPVAPWNSDQDGAVPDPLDVPWLNYMNTVVAFIDKAAREKSAAGIPLAAPDGFALTALGRPELVPVPDREPAADLHRPAWGQAQAGFRVYRDWLAIINRHATTRGLPAYITSTSTFTADSGVPPAQNYPAGWLTAALDEINTEPQIQALCWFVDPPFGELWQAWSLAQPQGHTYDAAAEFDRLLQR